jgi:DNA ligase D-like protein (predicted 3'-phosphoesterase)
MTSARDVMPAHPRFVIQKHAASTLHYDFRLEVDGVLRSWAVPKGPSTDPQVKRLAVEVEDHALGHADFEGRAGRGAVIVWDAGTYRNLHPEQDMAEALAAGHASVWLQGTKLTGGWTLQRTAGGRQPQWLLVKRRDDHADADRDPEADEPRSVKSGRTLEEVAQSDDADAS